MINNIIPWNWLKKDTVSKDEPKIIKPAFDKTIERIFEDFLSDFGSIDNFLPRLIKGTANSNVKIMPRIDISEKDNHLIIEADLPGVKERDLDISVAKDNTLTIRGNREEKQEEKDRNYYHLERSYGSFERSMSLPNEYDKDNAEANFKDGILTLRIGKKEIDESDVKKININYKS